MGEKERKKYIHTQYIPPRPIQVKHNKTTRKKIKKLDFRMKTKGGNGKESIIFIIEDHL